MSDRVSIVLAGQPNTGKSVFFNRITGIGVISSNYPGTTVEIMEGWTKIDGLRVRVIDTPGIYSLDATSPDQMVARRVILETRPAVIINIIDATHLERNLYLTLQLLELEVPMVVALNMVDEASKRGIKIDHEKLSEFLGVPVIPTVATRGEGVFKAVKKAMELLKEGAGVRGKKLEYGKDIERVISALEEKIRREMREIPFGISPRALAILLLQRDPEIVKIVSEKHKEVVEFAEKLASAIESMHGEQSSIRIAKERYALAHMIANSVVEKQERRLLRDVIDEITTTNIYTGIPIMMLVVLALFSSLVYIGGMLEEIITTAWELFVVANVEGIITAYGVDPLLRVIILNGVLLGLEAGLAIVIPYIVLFYILLSVLEDTGYLARIAYLLDGLMHRLGLHGRALIPLIVGYGCNVPAIVGTRVLETRRERFIAAFLISIVPCSARTVVILGIVGSYLGIMYALGVYAIGLLLLVISGVFLNRILSGERVGLVMEIPPYRVPHPVTVLKKTWIRFREFVYIAFPLLIIGSIVLSLLEYFEMLDAVTRAMSPLMVTVLGLPPVTAVPIIFGIFRKEMVIEMLVVLSGTTDLSLIFTPTQMIVFAVVTMLYFPCIASLGALAKELGWRDTILIALGTMALAITVGAILNVALRCL
ncbi:MAG: ferrous iron transport protein B [Candidatus Baldrarchaeia archaeon]